MSKLLAEYTPLFSTVKKLERTANNLTKPKQIEVRFSMKNGL